MKIKNDPEHGEIGHFCHGGCAGYAKGGRIEQPMEARARNRKEIGLPATESSLSTLMDQVPGIGLATSVKKGMDIRDRLANPEFLHNTAGRGLETNVQRGGPYDHVGREADVQVFSKGGEVEGTKDPSEIPEDVLEYIESAHKATRESRPDEGWRISPMEKKESIAPYKREEEEAEKGWADLPENVREEGPGSEEVPNFDEGGQVPDPNKILADIAPAGTGQLAPSPAPQPAAPPPIPAPPPPTIPALTKIAVAAPGGPTDQDFMGRANKMLGLNPEEQAGFMKLLGNNAQKAQIGAGIAGIGDAIAAGGTLGKVNPGALRSAEEQIQGRTKEGLEGMQTIRGNQEKAQELSDKLESRDPNSPLSRWAQKAYAGVGKKIGLDLSNASAALIGDVSGKGVDALRTDYEAELKKMGLDLQKQQVAATVANQKAERVIAREGHQAEAAKTLADRGVFKTLANAIPGTSGHNATKILEKQAQGFAPDVLSYAQKHGITPDEAQSIKDKRTGGQ